MNYITFNTVCLLRALHLYESQPNFCTVLDVNISVQFSTHYYLLFLKKLVVGLQDQSELFKL